MLRAVKLFGSEVFGCAYGRTIDRLGQVRQRKMAREAKIDDYWRSVWPDADVRRLDIAMDDFFLLHSEESVTEGDKELCYILNGPWLPWDQRVLQILAFNELLNDVVALLARLRRKRVFDELDDVGMIDCLKSLNFAVEPVAFIVGSDQLETEISAGLIFHVKGGFLLARGQWPDKSIVWEHRLRVLN